jgi:dGTPase
MGQDMADMSKNLGQFLEADGFASFASRPQHTKGRLFQEDKSRTRDDYHRDRDRVIHSTAFRRLKFKTQVFVYHEGDHYRTRLSHSIEVAQVARSLARYLKCNEDLAETCALAHDLGHTPFAHVGEDALKESMAPYGGFDHNDQTLRVVTMLEKRYPLFDGLNLTWESLEGLVKHNGPVTNDQGQPLDKKGNVKKFEITLNHLKDQWDLKLNSFASIEAQVAGIADDVAYNSHDIDDGLAAGVFTLKDLAELPLLGRIMVEKRKAYPNIDDRRLVAELVREIMGIYVIDVMQETQKRILDLNPKTADDIRHSKMAMVSFSDEGQKNDKEIRSFLWDRFYSHYEVARMRVKVFKVVQDLFKVYMDSPRCLPAEWLSQIEMTPAGMTEKDWQARVIADCIASMTDRFALLEHQKLFDPYLEMR